MNKKFFIDWDGTGYDEWDNYDIDPTWWANTPEDVIIAVEEFLPYVERAPQIKLSCDYEVFKNLISK